MGGRVRVGISGWTYDGWRGRFYPEGLARRRELEYASRCFDTVEVNGTFYSLQRPDSFRRWYEETPDGFTFAVKGSRFLTHMKKLRDPGAPLANFFASGILRLADKMGPVLWQFPESFSYDHDRLRSFLELLPGDTEAAASLARKHDHRLTGRAWLKPEHRGRIRHAFEVRSHDWLNDGFLDLLRRHRAALVFADTAERWPYAEDVTADFLYLRLHGTGELYAGGYDDDALDWWAQRIRAWADGGEPRDAMRSGKRTATCRRSGREVFVYFDNDAKVRAPADAASLARRLGTGTGTPCVVE